MNQTSINLFDIPFAKLCQQVKDHFPNYHYGFTKHQIILKDKDYNPIGQIRLPLHVSLSKDLEVVTEYRTVIYLSISAGNGSICIMEGVDNVYHTTFKAYMTRKKQGVSQIKYLNKKGKSRAGSRVRLAATFEFFEKINVVLTELFDEFDIDRIAINCSPTMIPYLYQSKEKCPFDKNDMRLYKIPLHIQQSNYTNLNAIIKKLMAPYLFFDKEQESEMQTFMDS